MKLLKTLMSMFLTLLCCSESCCDGAVEVQVDRYTMADLLDAIAVVESNCEFDAVGDNGEAIGIYQIHKIYVDDVNRILKGTRIPKYSYADRWNPFYSRLMVKTYLLHYGEGKGIEAMARIHNGGPDGWKKESTKPYWEKVKAVLQAQYEGIESDVWS